jgi:hypothetical protein
VLRNDAICRYLADTLGKTTGKKIELEALRERVDDIRGMP